jgi:NADH:ubiquinone oxidoreductase subunit 6 (subunit J)
MNRLVALVMLLTLAAICVEIVRGEYAWWIAWGSLLVAASGFVPTLMRTVPNARRLGTAQDSPEERTRLARAICRDHMLSFARMSVLLILQLIAR